MMKTILLTFLLACTNFSFAQWGSVYADASITLNDIQFTSSNIGYVIGSDGSNAILLKTTNSGTTWTESILPGISFANHLYFLNDTVGYVIVAGVPNHLLKTNNGGSTWTITTLDSAYFVVSLCMFNEHSGYYMNNEGRLRRIIADGADYGYLTDTLTGSGAIVFPDATNGYIAGDKYVLKTNNSGMTWSTLSTGLSEDIYGNAFAFGSSTNGFLGTRDVSENGNIYFTNDGANTWNFVKNFAATQLDYKGTTCIAVNDTGNVTFSTNNGVSWIDESLPILFTGSEMFVCEIAPDNTPYVITGFEILKRLTPMSVNNTTAANSNDLVLFPNPATETVNINCMQNTAYSATVFDAYGKLVITTTITTVDVSTLEKGVYTVILRTTDNNSKQSKFIKL